MAASANVKKPCTRCNKGAGVTTCDGCQQSLCVKHFVEHRQELSQRIDDIGQEHDLLWRDIDHDNTGRSLLSRINLWEQESIAKIQVEAKAARTDLEELLEKSKQALKKSVTKITNELQSCRESDDYTEIDIEKWTNELKTLRKRLDSSSTIRIEENKNPISMIRLIRVCDQQQHRSLDVAAKSPQYCTFGMEDPNLSRNERFDEIIGNAVLSEERLVVTCGLANLFIPSIHGANLYSFGLHRIHFRIDKIGDDHIFFGIASSDKTRGRGSVNGSLYGWWDLVKTVVDGQASRSEPDKLIRAGDGVTLTLDCDNGLIQLLHHQTDRLVESFVNIENCPFPWKIVVKLASKGDSVRILL